MAIQAPALSDLIMKIQKLVVGCHKLEMSLGQTLDQETVMGIADSMITVLIEYVDEDNIEDLTKDLVNAITKTVKHVNDN